MIEKLHRPVASAALLKGLPGRAVLFRARPPGGGWEFTFLLKVFIFTRRSRAHDYSKHNPLGIFVKRKSSDNYSGSKDAKSIRGAPSASCE